MAAGSSAAIAISAAALAQSNAAKLQACKAIMRGFTNDTATVAEVQAYGECARKVYPAEWSPEALIAAKVVVALLLAGFVIGAVHGIFRRGIWGPIEGPIMHAFSGLLISAGSVLTIALVYAGVKFLMN